jgi:hypothetical protein
VPILGRAVFSIAEEAISVRWISAVPGTSVGIYSGSVLYFFLGYFGALVLVFSALCILLLPFLPLMAFVASSDVLAKAAAIVLPPAYFVLVGEAGSFLVSIDSLEGARSLWAGAGALLPWSVVPAMIIVLNFFVIEDAVRKRDAASATDSVS